MGVLNGLSKLLKALWLFFSGLVGVLLIYYLLIGVEQGIDVVIRSGELLDSGVLTIFSVFLWSFLVWYSSRTLSYIRQHKDDEIFSKQVSGDMAARLYDRYGIPAALYRHIPRLLAYNCFVSVQVAIFHLPTFFGWSTGAILAAVMGHNALYFLLTAWFQEASHTGRRKWPFFGSVLVIAAYAAFMIYLIVKHARGIDVLHHPLRHTFWLSLMALALFLLQVAMVYLFVRRRRSIDARRLNPSLHPSPLLRLIGFNPEFNAAEAPYFRLLNSTALVAIIIYIAAIFIMDFSMLMGPMAFSLLALGVLCGFSNLVTLLSIRSSFNVMVILFVLAFIFGQYRDPYAVRFLRARGPIFSERPDGDAWLEKWFSKRLPMVARQDSTARFPVYLVLSNGGASRAGSWTSAVLSHLQDTSWQRDSSNSFRDHVLCIAGSSGGAVGNCAFYGLLDASRKGLIRPDEFSQHSDRFFETDFLTPILGRLLGPDIFRHLLPFNLSVYDRADILEHALAQGSADTLLNAYFEHPVSHALDTSGWLPALFINTTQVDNGMPGVISTVRLRGSQRQDVLSLVDSMGKYHGTGDMRYSTAAVLSSRFPYVSPAGKVFDRYYVDGGYFDNSGAGTVLEFINVLNRFLADTTRPAIAKYRDRFSFHILHITNAEVVPRPARDIHPLTNDLLSPILTLAGMQGASTSIGDSLLVDVFRQINADSSRAIVYSLYDPEWDADENGQDVEDGYPMSWMLSHYQRARMESALLREHRRNSGRGIPEDLNASRSPR